MKKSIAMIVALLMMFSSIGIAAANQKDRPAELPIKVLYNARQIASDVHPEVKSGVVFVPFRAVADALGAQLTVTPDWKTITFVRGDRRVSITLGSRTAVVNGEKKTLPAAPYATNGRTMVPTRFVSEQLGETVEWDPLSRYVWIGSQEIPTVEEKGIKQKPIEEVSQYFVDAEHLLKDSMGVPYTGYYELTVDDLPVRIGDYVYYSVGTTEVNGILGFTLRAKKTPNIFYVTSSLRPKFRYPVKPLDEKHADQTMTSVYRIQESSDEIFRGDKDYMKFKLSDALYIGFDDGNDALVLLKNPFRG